MYIVSLASTGNALGSAVGTTPSIESSPVDVEGFLSISMIVRVVGLKVVTVERACDRKMRNSSATNPDPGRRLDYSPPTSNSASAPILTMSSTKEKTQSLLLLGELTDSVDTLPQDLIKAFGDLRELDAVLRSERTLPSCLATPWMCLTERRF